MFKTKITSVLQSGEILHQMRHQSSNWTLLESLIGSLFCIKIEALYIRPEFSVHLLKLNLN